MYSDIQTKIRIEAEFKLAYTTAILVCMYTLKLKNKFEIMFFLFFNYYFTCNWA